MSKERVLVAMSGGVDSSVAAALLVKAGYDCVGVTMKIWPKALCGSAKDKSCCSLEGVTYARSVAEDLNMPYYVLDLYEEFDKEVIGYFCDTYMRGLTPNPCVVCNERMKFGVLLKKARELGASKVATGHFARSVFNKRTKRFSLREGKDKTKDQTYFLFSLNQEQLAAALFPLCNMTKDAARKVAKKMGLRTYNRLSSQDICFVKDEEGYAGLLKERFADRIKPGRIIDLGGKVLGTHKGFQLYTLGQRQGLGIAHKEPLYVIKIDSGRNELVVGPKERTKNRTFIVDDVNWVSIPGIDAPMKALVKIRYNQTKAEANIAKEDKGALRVTFDETQNSITPGQAAVFYKKDIVLGGGWIKEVIE